MPSALPWFSGPRPLLVRRLGARLLLRGPQQLLQQPTTSRMLGTLLALPHLDRGQQWHHSLVQSQSHYRLLQLLQRLLLMLSLFQLQS